MARYLLVAGAVVLAALALWRPAPRPLQAASQTVAGAASPSVAHRSRRHGRGGAGSAAGAAVVYVVGAVRRPGLYTMQAGDRVADAVERAGGLTAAADPAGVNLAARVADGDEIDVPLPGALPARSRSRVPRARRSPAPPSAVDVNAASAAELARVPGIGRALAGRIVELRERDGAYGSLDELLDVDGMTAARLERARPFLLQP